MYAHSGENWDQVEVKVVEKIHVRGLGTNIILVPSPRHLLGTSQVP